MSSHEPFIVPMETKIPGDDSGSKLKNAIAYTDQCLGEFFEKCKNCIAAHMGEDGFVLDHYKEAGEEVIDFVRGRIARINPYHFSL